MCITGFRVRSDDRVKRYAIVCMVIVVIITGFTICSVESSEADDTLTYTLVDGVLTFSGNGPMADYTASSQPWKGEVVTQVVWDGNPTKIGSYAFYGLSGLQSVPIPGTVTTIGHHAFSNMAGLTSISIPASVASIGDEAFSQSASLKTVNFNATNCADFNQNSNIFAGIGSGSTIIFGPISKVPAYICYNNSKITSVDFVESPNLKTLGAHAFSGMTGLTSIKIPAGVTSIADSSFNGCTALTTINFNATNCADFTSSSGIFKDVASGSKITFGSVSKIPAYICNGNSKITVVEFSSPASVKTVGSNAFSGMTGLTSFTIPTGVTTFSNTALYGCSSLKTINFNATNCADFTSTSNIFKDVSTGSSITFGENVKVPAYVCYNNSKFTTIGFSSVASIGAHAFENTVAKIDLSNNDTITSYGADSFKNSAIVGVAFTSKMTSFNANAFTGCTQLTHLHYNAVKPSAVTSSPFLSLNKLNKVTFGSSVSSIPSYMFDGVIATYDPLPSSILTIGDYAFVGCTISMEKLDKVTSIGKYAFNGSTIAIINIPSTLKNLGEGAFYGCFGTTSINYSAKELSDFKSSPFGNIIGAQVTLGKSVVKVPANVFNGNFRISSIPSSVTTIGENAFRGSTINDMSEATAITTISARAFEYCSINSIYVPASLKTLGEGAFQNCINVISVFYKSSSFLHFTEYSAPFASSYAGSGTLIIDSQVTKLPDYIFYGASYIHNIENAQFLSDLGSHSLNGCPCDFKMDHACYYGSGSLGNTGIRDIVIDSNTLALPKDLFDGCSKVRTITYDTTAYDGSFTKDSNPFKGIESNGIEVSFGSSVVNVPRYIFYGCSNVAHVNLNMVKTIGDYAFYGSSIAYMHFSERVESIGPYAFGSNNRLDRLEFDNFYTRLENHSITNSGDAKDIDIVCYRKAVQNDYNWRGNGWKPSYEWKHIDGEYEGMMSIIFNIMTIVLPTGVTNDILDFFVDNNALHAIEAIDLGSDEANTYLLVGIALVLFMILFILLYLDRSELVRIVETLLTMMFVLIILYSCVRRVWEYLDSTAVKIILSIFLVCGLYYPVIATIKETRRKASPLEGETLIRLFTLDRGAIKSLMRCPLQLLIDDINGFKVVKNMIIVPLCAPVGLLLSLLFMVICGLVHLPAYLITLGLSKIFTAKDINVGKHTKRIVCPECGKGFETPIYKCPECFTMHDSLRTGKFGIKTAICKCGKRLPCSIRGHPWEVCDTICPECRKCIRVEEAEPFSMIMLGTPGSGKTTLAVTTSEYLYKHQDRLKFEVSRIGTETNRVVDDVKSGMYRQNNIMHYAPLTTLFKTKHANHDFITAKAVYYYDLPGEILIHDSEKYLDRTWYKEGNYEGIILVINPYESRRFSSERGVPLSGEHESDEVLSSFLRTYELINETKKASSIDEPLAIVLTHSREAGIMAGNGSEEEVKAFLEEQGMYNLINEITNRFSNVRYYAYDVKDTDTYVDAFEATAWIIGQSNGKMDKYLLGGR